MELPPMPIKLIALGKAAVGKTSISHYYVNHKSMLSSTASLGVDMLQKNTSVNGTSVNLQILDTAGNDKLRNIPPNYFRYV